MESRGSSSTTSQVSTCAPGGPCSHQRIICSTAAGEPWNTASTRPSRRFRTQPDSSSSRARSRVDWRKKTPCTRPEMKTRRWMSGTSRLFRGELIEHGEDELSGDLQMLRHDVLGSIFRRMVVGIVATVDEQGWDARVLKTAVIAS